MLKLTLCRSPNCYIAMEPALKENVIASAGVVYSWFSNIFIHQKHGLRYLYKFVCKLTHTHQRSSSGINYER